MTEKETGGPAFPSHGSMGEVVHEGMPLRDYFAVHASDADVDRAMRLVPKDEMKRRDENSNEERMVLVPKPNAAQLARYVHADLMLEARK